MHHFHSSVVKEFLADAESPSELKTHVLISMLNEALQCSEQSVEFDSQQVLPKHQHLPTDHTLISTLLYHS
jgi:quercetin dioxygenase-like cupin family protein